jgi:hypothetical protein
MLSPLADKMPWAIVAFEVGFHSRSHDSIFAPAKKSLHSA